MLGLGGYAADFFQGTRDQSQQMLGQRQAAARAFQEFKAQNPTANYSEFQQFVDNMSGGSNYLRGAMPAREVLETLGKQNEVNRRAQAVQQQTAALASQQQQEAAIRASIDSARRAGIRDPFKITEMVAQQLGVDKSQDAQGFLQIEDMMRNINPSSVINELDQSDLLGSLEFAQRGIGRIFDTESAVLEAFPAHLRGTPLEEKYKAQAKSLYGNFIGQRRESLFKSALATALPLISAGASEASIAPIVQEIYGKMYPGAPTDLNMIADVTKDVVKRVTEDRTATLTEERASDMAKFNDFATSPGVISIMRNNPGNADELLRAEAKLVFPNLGDAEVNAMVTAAKRRAVMVVEDQQTTEYRTIEAEMPGLISKRLEENAKAINGFVTKDTPPNIAGALSILQAQGVIVDPVAVPSMIEAASEGEAADLPAAELAALFSSQFGQYLVDPREEMEMQLQSAKPEKREERLQSALEFLGQTVRQIATQDYVAARKISDLAGRMDALSEVLGDAQQLLMETDAMIEDADADSQPWALASSSMSPEAYSKNLRTYAKQNKAAITQLVSAIEAEISALRRGGSPTPSNQQAATSASRSARPTSRGGGRPPSIIPTGRAPAPLTDQQRRLPSAASPFGQFTNPGR